MRKRFLAILLVCMMVVGMLPTTALAAGTASNNAVKVDLVKDSTTFSGKEVLRVDFYAISGTDTPDNHMVYLKYDATKMYPAAQGNGADASSVATDFSVNKSSVFTKNNYAKDDGFGGKENSEVMLYTVIKENSGYICWKVTEPSGTPAFADYTHISSIFFGLKEGTTFDALPSDAIDYHNPQTDTTIACANAVEITVNGGGEENVFIWKNKDGKTDTMTVTPTINAGEGVTIVKPEYSGSVSAPTVTKNKGGAVELQTITITGETVEYGYSETNSAASVTNWQTGTTFNGLTVGKTLYFFARVTETSEHSAKASEGTEVTVNDKETPTISVVPTASTITYGQTLASSTLSGGTASTTGTFAWKTSTTAPTVSDSNVTEYEVVFTPSNTADYATATCKVKLTVNPKTITPTIADISDQEVTGSQITPAITVTGDSRTLVKDTDYTVTYGANTSVGTGSVTIKAVSGSNYTFTDVTKNFNIVAAASTISITSDPSKTYDGSAVTDPTVTKTGSTATVTYAYYKNADCTTQTSTADGAASNGAAPKNAGDYWVKASVAADANYGSATSEAKAFTISPKNASGLTIELPATLPTFTGSEQTITVTVKDSGTTLALDKDYTVSGNSATNVGNTTLTVTGKGNYTGTATTTWSLQKATPVVGDFSITAPGSKPYTGSPISVTAPTSSKNGIGTQRTVYYEGTSGTSYTKSTTAPTNVGTYTVTFDVNAGSNYNAASDLVLGTLTITKADYSGNKTFTTTVRSGQVNSGVTVTLPALPAGASYGTITVGGTGSTLIDGTPTASETTLTFNTTNQTDGTEATITIPVTGATNYNDYSLTVTVTAKDKENAGVSIADATKTTTYGTNVTISATATATGGEWSWTFPSDTFEAVGATNSASITLKPLKATDSAATVTAKYESETHIGEATASVTVGKKNVTITGLSAQNKVYNGNTAATVTGTAVISGKVGSDDVTVTAGTAAFADENVGSGKTVTFTGYTLSGTKAGNYNLTAQPASVTANITAKDVTVTGVTATNRAYASGNTTVALTGGTVSGAVGGDTVTVNLTNARGTIANEDVGDNKAVTVTGVALSGTDAGNYRLTGQPTGITVNITKATYGAGPALSQKVRATGEAQNIEVDVSTHFGSIKGAAVSAAAKGTDTNSIISSVTTEGNKVKFSVANTAVAGNTATINITISCTNFKDITSVLTVEMIDKEVAGVSISGAPAEAKTYGDADFVLTATAAVPGENGVWTWESSNTSILTVTGDGNRATVKIVGTGTGTTIKATYVSDTSAGERNTAAIRVNPGTITVAAKNQSIYVNGTAPDLTSPVKDTHYTVTGLAAGETLGGTISMKYQKDGVDATPDVTKTGTYDIVISGATAPAGGNYNDVVFTAGTLTISNRPSSGGGGNYNPTYSVTADKAEHGTVSISPKSAAKGATVTVTVKPDEGYELDTLTVTDKDGKAVAVTGKDGKYIFTMPASKVTVKAAFKEAEKPVTMSFVDVAEGAWYYDSVKYVFDNSMMVGTSDTTFSPSATTTRGMIVTILYRLEGEPTVSGKSSFDDVVSGRWYANAVQWAAENKIVGGYGDGTFGPEDPISREQMAAILYRYAAFKGYDMTKTADLSKFTDSDKISDWAKFALSWANAEGLINGKGNGILDPLGKATRAEVATILRNFCENVVK